MVQIISTDGLVRSKNLIEELDRQKIEFKFSPGFIPDNEDFIRGKLHSPLTSKLICQRKITVGEVGCAIAHKIAATNLLNSNYSYGLTFEDDAEIIENLEFSILEEYLNSSEPTLIFLGWIPGYAIAKEKKFQKGNKVIELITPPTCAFAYAFNREAANLIVADKNRVIDLADWPIHLFKFTKFFIVKFPWAVAPQNPELSLIGKRVETRKNFLLYKFWSRTRLVISLLILLISKRLINKNISNKHIFNRLILKDLYYMYGQSEINKGNSEANIVFLRPNSPRIINLLNRNTKKLNF